MIIKGGEMFRDRGRTGVPLVETPRAVQAVWLSANPNIWWCVLLIGLLHSVQTLTSMTVNTEHDDSEVVEDPVSLVSDESNESEAPDVEDDRDGQVDGGSVKRSESHEDYVSDILEAEAQLMGEVVPAIDDVRDLDDSKKPGDGGSSDQGSAVEEPPISLEDHLKQAVAVLKPVALTMILVVILVRVLNPQVVEETEVGVAWGSQSPGGEGEDESYAGLVGQIPGLSSFVFDSDTPWWLMVIIALVNAVLFMALIVVVTCVLLLLFYFKCMKIIYGWLMMSSGLLLSVFGGFTFYALLYRYNVPFDFFSFMFLLFNFGLAGVVSIFWRSPKKMKQGFLILVSVLLANGFTLLPDILTWFVLGVVAFYDIFAVLAPKGPLKMIVKLSQKRGQPIPGLLYEVGMAAPIPPDEASCTEEERNLIELNRLDPPVGHTVKLGLGDFVFYSVLLGRAALYDLVTVFTCFIAVLMGLICTLILLLFLRRALPALPFSIFAGIFFYYMTRLVLVPYAIELGLNLVFIC